MSTNSAVAPVAGAGNGHSGLQALTPEAQWSYADLKRVLTKQGLLKRQHRYYARELFVTFALSGLAIGLMVTLGQSWWQLGTAVLFAFVSLRWAYVGHDGGHRQIFARPLHNDALVIGSTSLWTGFSLSWWMDQHNRHHAFPNHDGRDPNATLGPFAFSPEQYQRKRGINRRIARLQAVLWLPLQTLGALAKQVENAFYLQRAPLRHKRTERLATLAHFSLYCAALVLLLSPAQAIAFAAIHYALFGLFLGSVIATNHKGRPMLTERMAADFFVAQVVTSHNVRGGRLLDYWFGGLNYQIEHHLFPNMPRNMLPRAAPLVRKVCHAREVEYSEGPFIDTYSSLLRFLHNVVAKDIPDNAPGEAERITVD